MERIKYLKQHHKPCYKFPQALENADMNINCLGYYGKELLFKQHGGNEGFGINEVYVDLVGKDTIIVILLYFSFRIS